MASSPMRRAGARARSVLALVAPVVFVVTLLATYILARRAARVNPVEALRYE
jgi:ABC-type lipoprotein release transport system permease subunit